MRWKGGVPLAGRILAVSHPALLKLVSLKAFLVHFYLLSLYIEIFRILNIVSNKFSNIINLNFIFNIIFT